MYKPIVYGNCEDAIHSRCHWDTLFSEPKDPEPRTRGPETQGPIHCMCKYMVHVLLVAQLEYKLFQRSELWNGLWNFWDLQVVKAWRFPARIHSKTNLPSSRGSSRCLWIRTWAAAAKSTYSSESHYVRTKVSPVYLLQEIQYLEFMGGSNLQQVFHYLICMCFIRINTFFQSSN